MFNFKLTVDIFMIIFILENSTSLNFIEQVFSVRKNQRYSDVHNVHSLGSPFNAKSVLSCATQCANRPECCGYNFNQTRCVLFQSMVASDFIQHAKIVSAHRIGQSTFNDFCQAWYGNRTCYRFVTDQNLTWQAAQNNCQAIGGFLVSVETRHESDLISSELGYLATGSYVPEFWTGGHRGSGSDVNSWFWMKPDGSATPFGSYEEWGQDMPDGGSQSGSNSGVSGANSSGSGSGGFVWGGSGSSDITTTSSPMSLIPSEECMAVIHDGYDWDDKNCSEHRLSVCEITLT